MTIELDEIDELQSREIFNVHVHLHLDRMDPASQRRLISLLIEVSEADIDQEKWTVIRAFEEIGIHLNSDGALDWLENGMIAARERKR